MIVPPGYELTEDGSTSFSVGTQLGGTFGIVPAAQSASLDFVQLYVPTGTSGDVSYTIEASESGVVEKTVFLGNVPGFLPGDTITHGATTVTMDFVTVGNPGNAADDAVGERPFGVGETDYGSVGYNYRIGTYDVSVNQWDMVVLADMEDLLLPSGEGWLGADQPASAMTWYDAAMFCNWLTSGDVTQGAYAVNGSGEVTGINRASALATYATVYALPTDDEWYKAAYYDGGTSSYYDYPTGSDTAPTGVTGGTLADTAVISDRVYAEPADVFNAGGLSPYGTMAQGGNVWEWTESVVPPYEPDNVSGNFGVRGGNYDRDAFRTSTAYGRLDKAWDDVSVAQGFRVVALIAPPPGDANLDGLVNEEDASILATYWQTLSGATWAMGDFNNDGMVNDIDATLMAANWGSVANAAVPEPAGMLLIASGLGMLLFRRHRQDL